MRSAVLALVITFAAGAALAQSVPPAATPTPAPPPSATLPAPGAAPAEDAEVRARAKKFRAACGADLQQHCSPVLFGRDATREQRQALRQCVDANKAKFSPACQTAIAAREADREARRSQRIEQPANPATDKPKG
jgi:hypothetical protein